MYQLYPRGWKLRLLRIFALCCTILLDIWVAELDLLDGLRPTTQDPEITFDYEYCAELHNELVRIAVGGSESDVESEDLDVFWNTVADQHDELLERISPLVIEFWSLALALPTLTSTDGYHVPLNLFYLVDSLVNPLNSWARESTMYWDDYNDDRYIVLYSATNIQSHSLGIVFDQQEFKAIMMMSLFSADVGHTDIQWQPLEVILEQYLDMIEMGKVKLLNNYHKHTQETAYSFEGRADPQLPWYIAPSSTQILSRTLAAFDKLLGAIEQRMPQSEELNTATRQKQYNLSAEAARNPIPLPEDNFAAMFLAQARMPNKSVRFIAPGIRIFNKTSLLASNQTQYSYDEEKYSSIFGDDNSESPIKPLLLFPIDGSVLKLSDFTPPGHPPFHWPYDNPKEGWQPGLYIDQHDGSSAVPFEDASVLILPYTIGQNDFSTSSDGFPCPYPSRTCLYQTWYNPFMQTHYTQLYHILENWADRVENGDWAVDEHGVAGGIEVFRDADSSRESSEKYRIPLSW